MWNTVSKTPRRRPALRYKVKTWQALAEMKGTVHVECTECRHECWLDAVYVMNQVGGYRPLVDPVFRCRMCGSKHYYMRPYFGAFY